MESCHFSAVLEQLHPMIEWISERAQRAGLDASSLQKLALASEEAIVNVITHAYRERGGDLEIRFKAVLKQGVEITLLDEGAPFNPLEEPSDAQIGVSLEERELGGLGLVFIKQFVDDASYRRQQHRNVLTLFKKFREC